VDAAGDDRDGLPGGDQLVLVLDGVHQGDIGRGGAVRAGVDAPERVPGRVGHLGDRLVRDVVQGDRLLAGQAVVHRDEEQAGLVVQDRHVQAVGRHLNVPVKSVTAEEATGHFGPVFAQFDAPASSARTQERFGWRPLQPGLIADLDQGHYYTVPDRLAH
jgi:hypothetical protein